MITFREPNSSRFPEPAEVTEKLFFEVSADLASSQNSQVEERSFTFIVA